MRHIIRQGQRMRGIKTMHEAHVDNPTCGMGLQMLTGGASLAMFAMGVECIHEGGALAIGLSAAFGAICALFERARRTSRCLNNPI